MCLAPLTGLRLGCGLVHLAFAMTDPIDLTRRHVLKGAIKAGGLLPVLATGCVAVPALPRVTSAALTRVPLKTGYSGRPIVPLMVNGQGPFDFILDTASTRSAIFDNLARRLRIEAVPGKRVRVFSFAAVRLQPVIALESVAMGAMAFNLPEVLLFEDWDNQAETPQGILGLDVLRQFLIHVDYPGRAFAIHPSATTPESLGPNARWAALEAEDFGLSHAGLYVLRASTATRRFPMLVDSGASISLGNRSLINRSRTEVGVSVGYFSTRIGGASGEDDATYILRLQAVRSQAIAWSNMRFFVTDAQIFRELGAVKDPLAILGFDQMRTRAFWFDFPQRSLYADESVAQADGGISAG